MRIHATEIVAVVAFITTGILSVSDAFSYPTTAVDVGDAVLARISNSRDKADCFSLFKYVGGFLEAIFSKAHSSGPVPIRAGDVYEKIEWAGMEGLTKARRAEVEKRTEVSMLRFYAEQGARPSLEHIADFVKKSPGSGFVAKYAERLMSSKEKSIADFGRTIFEHLPHAWKANGLTADGVFQELKFEFERLDFMKVTLLETFIKLSSTEGGGKAKLLETLLKFYGDYQLELLLTQIKQRGSTYEKEGADRLRKELKRDWSRRDITIDDVDI